MFKKIALAGLLTVGLAAPALAADSLTSVLGNAVKDAATQAATDAATKATTDAVNRTLGTKPAVAPTETRERERGNAPGNSYEHRKDGRGEAEHGKKKKHDDE